MRNRAHITAQARKQRFLQEFRAGGIASEAARRTPVNRMTIYHRWMKDSRFAKEYESIREGWLDRLEGELLRLGTGVYAEPITSGGRIVGERRIRSETALLALLRAYRGAFRERVAMEMSGGVTQTVTVVKKSITATLIADVTKLLADAGVGIPDSERPALNAATEEPTDSAILELRSRTVT